MIFVLSRMFSCSKYRFVQRLTWPSRTILRTAVQEPSYFLQSELLNRQRDVSELLQRGVDSMENTINIHTLHVMICMRIQTYKWSAISINKHTKDGQRTLTLPEYNGSMKKGS